jgi:hypothetical protein
MALKQNIIQNVFGQDITIPNSYIKVASIFGNKIMLSANVAFYDEEMKNLINTQTFTFTPKMNGENFIKQTYNYLKILPEFNEAVDC